MARNRMIKKEFWTSEQVMNLTIPARLLFIGMWNQADDEGILKNSALQLKAQIFPCDEQITVNDIKNYLNDILNQGLIAVNSTHDLIKIKKWKEHQKISRPTPSTHEFIEGINEDSLSTHGVFIEDSMRKERKGIERNRIEKNKTEKSINKLFEDFWDAYPRKENKKKSETAFNRLSKVDQRSCIEGVNTYKEYIKVNKTSKQHIKLPSTYINGQNWNDELIITGCENAEYKMDVIGKSAIGYCESCGKSDFYDPAFVRESDSYCCKVKVLPKKPNVKKIPVNPQVKYKTQVKPIGELLKGYK